MFLLSAGWREDEARAIDSIDYQNLYGMKCKDNSSFIEEKNHSYAIFYHYGVQKKNN